MNKDKYQKTIYNLVHLSKAKMDFEGVHIDRKQLEQDINVLWELYNKYQEFVGKETPKKPIKIKTDYMEQYVCPNCRHTYEGFSYCRFCGQKFDRSSEDE